MSANRSFLSDNHYGYDFVVATTQASINATMQAFLAKLSEPVATAVFVADERGNPILIDYQELKNRAQGSDPFTVPADADPATNPDLKNLLAARFMAGFRARLGLPKGFHRPTDIPDLVILGVDTANVTFNMLCSEFQIVHLNPGGWGTPTWDNLSQPAGAPWIIQSKVDLRLSVVDGSAYSQLPDDVKAKIKTLGGEAFSVRQLLFDLANARLASPPTVAGVAPGSTVYLLLQQYFVGAYFVEMRKNGDPLLGAAVTQSTMPTGTLTMTDLNMEVSPFVGTNGQPVMKPTTEQQHLATLDYLCGVNGDILPPATRFGWNWIEPGQARNFHGVVSINRNTFATWFKNQLFEYVESNCWNVHVRVWADPDTHFEAQLTPNQMPDIRLPATGSTVLSFSHYSESDDDALGGALGRMEMRARYNVDVVFEENTIKINQHFLIYLSVSGAFGVNSGGNIIDRTYNDTYTLAASSEGKLTATLTKDFQDRSENIEINDILNVLSGNINDIISDKAKWAQKVTSHQLKDIPLNVIQDFVFPGGRTFAFKSVHFSNHQDMVAHITYVDPA